MRVGTVRPDLSLFDGNGEPIRFIEVVDTHAPQSNVHEYALHNGIEIVEVHLRAEREFTATRRNKALDASLTVKACKNSQLAGFRSTPTPCSPQASMQGDRGTPLSLRTVEIRTKDCWKCGRNVNVAMGHKDGETLDKTCSQTMRWSLLSRTA